MPFIDLPPDELVRYRSSAPVPDDFDDFWRETLAEAGRQPLQARFEPVDAGLRLVDVFDVTFSGFGGHPIRGWFIRPAGATPGLTGIVKYHGYNGGRGFPHEHLLWPATGRALLVMDTRGRAAAGPAATRRTRSAPIRRSPAT